MQVFLEEELRESLHLPPPFSTFPPPSPTSLHLPPTFPPPPSTSPHLPPPSYVVHYHVPTG